ncbi:cupin domain-containing protein [Castellaniella defragrans]|uniref:Cupin domain-containing protein n=1 Tax=Castellaniella defragrans TaxID=75697 RepID=A0A7W9WMM8_CASDE|nr:hypothetical protein [Castellaniella defragrans]KAB0615359.1 hypothetical protein F7Q88_09080 [Castellaniella defragrans]MBB6082956.1 hypothetical protein [Castellaniella defragrans]
MCWMKKERRSPVVSGSMMGRLPVGRPIIALAAAACAILAVPAAAQELVLYGPQEVAGFASAPSDTGTRGLTLLSHDQGPVRVMRAWFPPDAKLEPHGKMDAGMAAIVTVLAGDMKLAMGDKYDESKLRDLSVGSVFVLTHGNAVHFARMGPAGAQLLLVVGPEKDLNADLMTRK